MRPPAALRSIVVLAVALAGCGGGDEPAGTSSGPPDFPRVLPAACGHAHNDYEHARPLLDALEQGFCSIEVDVFVEGSELLVAHEASQLDPTRTLRVLYLDPLRQAVQAGAMGDDPLLLLIDVKTEAAATYQLIDEQLGDYSDMLTSFEAGDAIPGAVTAVISGNRDRATMEAQGLRFAAMDGRIEDLGSGASLALIPLISDAWFRDFVWLGSGSMPADERATLDAHVQKAHQEGRRLRFWGGPDTLDAWGTQLEAGVDLINTDDLSGFATFLAGG
jgi:hypothetical protein